MIGSAPNVGALLDGRYRVIEPLGEGGMGVVWRVADTLHGDRRVALKLLRADHLNEDAAAAFRREFALLARLKHPNLVRVYDFRRDPATSRHFLTMDAIEGDTLAQRVARDGALPEHEVAAIAVQLCRALAFVHSRGVRHRDVTPRNLVWHEGLLVLLDFGLALVADDRRAGASGTLRYLAPEVLRSEGGEAADLFGLGATLYELLVGRPLMDLPSARSLARLLGDRTAWSLHLTAALLSLGRSRWSALLRHLLAWDPAERPRHPSAVITAISEATGRAFAPETTETREAYALGARFVGRRSVLARLGSWLDGSDGRPTRPVVLRGVAGIGKSRVAMELRRHAQLRGARVLEARFPADPQAGRTVLVDEVLSAALRWVPEDVVEELGPRLVRLMPNHPRLRDQRPSTPLDARAEATRVADAVVQALIAAADTSPEPLLLLVEDFPRADEATRAVLHGLAQRQAHGASAPALRVLLTLRDEEAPRVEAMLEGLRDRARLEELSLAPFEHEDMSLLTAAVFGDERVSEELAQAVAWLHGHVGGNPLHVIEALRCLMATGRIDREPLSGRWTVLGALSDADVPHSVRGTIAARLDGLTLDDAGRRVLETVALLARPTSIPMLEALCAGDDVVRVVTHLERREILVVTLGDGEAGYGFAHGLVERAVADQVRGAESLHHHICDVLAAWRPAVPVARLVRHALAAGRTDDQALTWLAEATTWALTRYANDDALTFAEARLAALPGAASRARFDATLELGQANARLGRWARAVGAFDDGRRVAGELSDGGLEAAADLAAGHVLHLQGAYDRARARFEAAASRHRERGDEPAGLARALGGLGGVHFIQCRYDEAEACLKERLTLIGPDGDPGELADTLGSLGRVHMYQLDYDQAAACFEREVALTGDRGDLARSAAAWGNLGVLNRRRGRYDEAMACYEPKLDAHHRMGDRQGIGVTWGNIAVVHWYRGRVDEAIRCCQRQLAVAIELGDRQSMVSVYGNMGDFMRKRGDVDAARRSFERAVELAGQLELAFFEGHYSVGRGELEADVGAWAEARSWAQRAGDLAEAVHDSAMAFNAALLAARAGVALAPDPESRSDALQALEDLVEGRVGEQAARAHDALFTFGGGIEHGHEALALFEAAFAESPTAQYRERADALRARLGLEEDAGRVSPDGAQDRFGEVLSVVRELSGELRAEAVLGRVVDLAVQFVDADRGLLFMREADGSLELRVSRPASEAGDPPRAYSQTVLGAVALRDAHAVAQHAAERLVGRPEPARARTADLTVRASGPGELGDERAQQTALPDAGGAADDHGASPACGASRFERRVKRRALVLASDEVGVDAVELVGSEPLGRRVLGAHDPALVSRREVVEAARVTLGGAVESNLAVRGRRGQGLGAGEQGPVEHVRETDDRGAAGHPDPVGREEASGHRGIVGEGAQGGGQGAGRVHRALGGDVLVRAHAEDRGDPGRQRADHLATVVLDDPAHAIGHEGQAVPELLDLVLGGGAEGEGQAHREGRARDVHPGGAVEADGGGRCVGAVPAERLEQLGHELGHARLTLGRLLGERPGDGLVHRPIDGEEIWPQAGGQPRRRGQVREQHRGVATIDLERVEPRQHHGRHHAEGVDVGPGVHVGGAEHELGGHVQRGADRDALGGDVGALGGLGVDGLGEAEVGDLHRDRVVVHARQQHVAGLDVAVDDAAPVGVVDGGADLEQEVAEVADLACQDLDHGDLVLDEPHFAIPGPARADVGGSREGVRQRIHVGGGLEQRLQPPLQLDQPIGVGREARAVELGELILEIARPAADLAETEGRAGARQAVHEATGVEGLLRVPIPVEQHLEGVADLAQLARKRREPVGTQGGELGVHGGMLVGH